MLPEIQELFAFDGPCINDRVTDIQLIDSTGTGTSYTSLLDTSFNLQDDSDGKCVHFTSSESIQIDLDGVYAI